MVNHHPRKLGVVQVFPEQPFSYLEHLLRRRVVQGAIPIILSPHPDRPKVLVGFLSVEPAQLGFRLIARGEEHRRDNRLPVHLSLAMSHIRPIGNV